MKRVFRTGKDSGDPWIRLRWLLPARLGSLSMGGRAIASNVLWLGGERIIRLLMGFLVGAWVGRYLGPERFGALAYAVAFVAIFQAIATLGSDTIVVRDLARRPDEAHELLGTLLRLRILAGMGCWLAAMLLAWLVDHSVENVVLIAIVGSTLLFQAADTIDLWFQSRLQSRRTVVVKLCAYGLCNFLRVLLILAHAPLVAFAAVAAVDAFAAAIGLVIAYRGYPTSAAWRRGAVRVGALLRQSWPFLVSSLSILIYMRIDQIMLRHLSSDYELGLFAAALPLSAVWQMIPVTLASSLAPLVAQRRENDRAAYDSTLLAIYRGFGAISLVVAAVTALLAPAIVPLLYGPAYAGAAPVLAIHAFSNVFIALGVAQGLWIANEGAGMINLLKTLSGGVVSILGNLMVIPTYGAVGAAWVTLLAFAVSGVLSNLLLAPEIVLNQLGLRGRLRIPPLIPTRRLPPDATERLGG